METAFNFTIQNIIYIDSNIFMVSLWVIDSYLNNEKFKLVILKLWILCISEYGSSGSFESRVRSKYIVLNTYKGRRSNVNSEPTPIHGPVHKYDLNHSYSRSHFIRLPQAVAKKIIYHSSQKVIYASKIIDMVINGLSSNDLLSHVHICDHSIVKFDIR